jgi:hypothetical protein
MKRRGSREKKSDKQTSFNGRLRVNRSPPLIPSLSQLNPVDGRLYGQSSRLQIWRFRVRFPALVDFLRSSGSGTASTHPRENN